MKEKNYTIYQGHFLKIITHILKLRKLFINNVGIFPL